MAKATSPAKSAVPQVVSLKVTLQGIRPPIWRRLLVPSKIKLDALHRVIQSAMGWYDCHLHSFDVGGTQYGDPLQLEGGADEKSMSLDRLIRSGVRKILYTYDFGDDWEHLLVVEKTLPTEDGIVVPRCIAGRRHCPPEDCGGVWGYTDLLDILADPSHPEHAERAEWVDDDFDAEAFSLDRINASLASTL